MNKSELRYLLKKYGVQPKKDFGQNFLVDQNIIKKIIATSNIEKGDTILEIGAGFGNLTQALAEKAGKVIAIEPDKKIFPALQNLSKLYKNIVPINESVFNIDFSEGTMLPSRLCDNGFKIISNLPYQITSHVFRHFLEHGPRPKSMCVMIQKEVADRIMAKVGQKSLLSLSIELYSDPKKEFKVSRSCFYPQPKVDSAVISLPEIKKKYEIDEKKFFQMLRIGFSAKRKKLSNNLENGLKLDKNTANKLFQKVGLSENCRAQELSLENWVDLFDSLPKI